MIAQTQIKDNILFHLQGFILKLSITSLSSTSLANCLSIEIKANNLSSPTL